MNILKVADMRIKYKFMLAAISLAALLPVFSYSGNAASGSEKYFLKTEKIVPYAGKTPQAPRISPDGRKLIYELYKSGNCELMLSDSDGKNSKSLTKGKFKKVENGFWHPSMNYISFNEIPSGKTRNGTIFTARIENDTLTDFIKLDTGARAQFSRPNGSVIFFEATSGNNNILKYRIIGMNPLKPEKEESVELRGPVSDFAENTELSHPSIAPDGATVLFAARSASDSAGIDKLNLTDGDRQRALELWKHVVDMDYTYDETSATLENLVNDFCNDFGYDEIFTQDEYLLSEPKVYFHENTNGDMLSIIDSLNDFRKYILYKTNRGSYNGRDFMIAWMLGLFKSLDSAKYPEYQALLYSRIWKTDIFGAGIVPLVTDPSVPLPQKWATISSSGKYAVFEAGHYSDRHIYIASMLNGKAVRLTWKGSYNSSAEISMDEKYLYFETNRSGKNDIWRAELDMAAIQEALK